MTFIAAMIAGYEARRLADLTQKALTVADKTAKAQLRAHVLSTKGTISISKDRRFYKITVHFKNGGPTPAYNLTYAMKSKVTKPGRIQMDYADMETNDEISNDLVGGEPWSITLYRERISSDDLKSLQNGTKVVFVWGVLKYRDGFQRCQKTEFHLQNHERITGLDADIFSVFNNASDPAITCGENDKRGNRKAKNSQTKFSVLLLPPK
jgi:hypothetical protein